MTETVEQHYGSAALAATIIGALSEAGHDTDHLDPDVLAPIEEFHTLGRVATAALAELAAIAPGDVVLDVGCGIGGPARFLARGYGARVVGVDLTAEFCAIARDLNERCGLAEAIEIRQADALRLPFADAAFDVVWSQHVAMNIADKAALYRELHRVARPGARLAFFDIVAGARPGPIHFPVPWAGRPELSYLEPAGHIRAAVEQAGFTIGSWEDLTEDGLGFFDRLSAGPPPDSPLGLHLIVPDMPVKAANVRRNIVEGRLALVRCLAKAAAASFSR